MTKDELVAGLQNDLQNEYKHLHFYIQAAAMVTGVEGLEVKEFFQEQAASELKHVSEFADVIVGLGFRPSVEVNSFPHDIHDAKRLLQAALEMEQEVLENFVQRMSQAEELGGVDGRWVVIFLEGQMEDTRGDVDRLKQLVRS